MSIKKTTLFIFLHHVQYLFIFIVLQTNINKSKKTQKEIKRDYIFLDVHQTTNVHFYNYNPNEDVKTLLIEVPIERIVNNSYSLNYATL